MPGSSTSGSASAEAARFDQCLRAIDAEHRHTNSTRPATIATSEMICGTVRLI